MPHSLEEKDGYLYIKETMTDFFEPRTITNYWPTGMQWYQFMGFFADAERARAAVGGTVSPTSTCTYRDVRGWIYRLPDGGKTKSAFTEVEPIPEPKQRGRKLPLEWKNGAWHKRTARGLVRI